MQTLPTLTIPDGAFPVPEGFCHSCGCAPDDPYSVHGKRGPAECSHWLHAAPEDPTVLADGGLLRVLVGALNLGGTVRMNPAMGARVLARLTDTVRIFTEDPR